MHQGFVLFEVKIKALTGHAQGSFLCVACTDPRDAPSSHAWKVQTWGGQKGDRDLIHSVNTY